MMIRIKPSPPPFLYNETATEVVRQNSSGVQFFVATKLPVIDKERILRNAFFLGQYSHEARVYATRYEQNNAHCVASREYTRMTTHIAWSS
jgi:hypothetical protein